MILKKMENEPKQIEYKKKKPLRWLFLVIPLFLLLTAIVIAMFSIANQPPFPPAQVCTNITPFIERNEELFAENTQFKANLSALQAQITEIGVDSASCKQELLMALNNKSKEQCSNSWYVNEIESIEKKLNKCLMARNNNYTESWEDLNECKEKLEKIEKVFE
jgi:hypothetical protein